MRILHATRAAAALAIVGAAAVGSTPAVALAHTPAASEPKHTLGRGTSTNWSGYTVDGTGATHVTGTWTEPVVRCASGESSWSSPWVGIDGDNSSTVEQIGTDSDCVSGTPVYYAWYEMYPKRLVVVAMAVHPGDSFTGEVSYTPAGTFVLKLTDNTTHVPTFTTTQSSKKAQRTSVEWIMEGPSNGLLSNFGSVSFSGAQATISGQTGSLGSFGSADPITMVSSKEATRAVPSTVAEGTNFGVTWQHG
jgi:hypothetical protein